MESVFLIKLLSRFSWFELFHLVRWKRAFPLVSGAALAALVRGAESTVLAEGTGIIRSRNAVSVPRPARLLGGSLCPATGEGMGQIPSGELPASQGPGPSP